MTIRKDYYKKILTWVVGMNLILSGSAQELDTLKRQDLNSMHLYELQNVWMETSNAAGISFNEGNGPGFLDVSYGTSQGDYRRVREGDEVRTFGLKTASYTKVGRVHFYGSFSYKNKQEADTRWTGMWDPNGDSPLVIGDSIGGDFDKECYHLQGMFGSIVKTSNFRWGVGIDFKSGSGAKQRDPRPQNKIMNIQIRPGVVWQLGKVHLGASLAYAHLKEEIEYKCEDESVNQDLFQFRGLGFYDDENVDLFYRNYLQDQYQGAMQLLFRINRNWKSMNEFVYTSTTQSVEDGKNVVKNAGDFNNHEMAIKSVFTQQQDSHLQRLILAGTMTEAETWEYIQEQKKVGVTYQWFTIAKNRKFDRKVYSGRLQYEYYKFGKNQRQKWRLMGVCNVKLKQETFNYVPGIYETEYSQLGFHSEAEKNFHWKSHLFAFGGEFTYAKGLTQKEYLPQSTEVLSAEFRNLALQDFWFDAEGFTGWGVNAAWQFPVSIKKHRQNLYVKASFIRHEPQSGFWKNEQRDFLNLNLGMIF